MDRFPIETVFKTASIPETDYFRSENSATGMDKGGTEVDGKGNIFNFDYAECGQWNCASSGFRFNFDADSNADSYLHGSARCQVYTSSLKKWNNSRDALSIGISGGISLPFGSVHPQALITFGYRVFGAAGTCLDFRTVISCSLWHRSSRGTWKGKEKMIWGLSVGFIPPKDQGNTLYRPPLYRQSFPLLCR